MSVGYFYSPRVLPPVFLYPSILVNFAFTRYPSRRKNINEPHQGIPQKGLLLTLLSTYWFNYLSTTHPTLKTHLLTLSLPASILPPLHSPLLHRSMQVRKYKIFPIEAIVRGYITGSAWKEYKKHGTVHGVPMVPGLRECEKLPGGALYTPSTKAEQGMHGM